MLVGGLIKILVSIFKVVIIILVVLVVVFVITTYIIFVNSIITNIITTTIKQMLFFQQHSLQPINLSIPFPNLLLILKQFLLYSGHNLT